MARVGLKWTVRELARRAGVMPNTVSRYENGRDAFVTTERALRDALLASGQVRFEGDDCACVKGNANEKSMPDSDVLTG